MTYRIQLGLGRAESETTGRACQTSLGRAECETTGRACQTSLGRADSETTGQACQSNHRANTTRTTKKVSGPWLQAKHKLGLPPHRNYGQSPSNRLPRQHQEHDQKVSLASHLKQTWPNPPTPKPPTPKKLGVGGEINKGRGSGQKPHNRTQVKGSPENEFFFFF